ncbi:hypothetical protein [Jatrophihabitans fulvus]
MPHHRDPDLDHESPAVVVGAVSIGTAPLPFLAVYATLFILHGTISPAHPPDITDSQTGELIAGIVAAVLFVALSVALWMFLGGRRRWPAALGEAAVLGTTIWFLTDETKGGAMISALLLLTSLVSLVLSFAPDGWRHVGRTPPGWISRLFREGRTARAGDPKALPGSAEPSAVEPASLRRRRGA